MNLNLVGGNAAASAPVASYTPPVQPAVVPREEEEPNALDKLLNQLSNVLTESVKSKDTRAAEAILKYLAGDESTAAGTLPPALVELLDTVIGTAEQAGKAEEFKALLGEYVALQWAISELDSMIAAGKAASAAGVEPKSDDYYEKLAAAKAFLKQLEAAIVGRLDTQSWYSDWRELYQGELSNQVPAVDTSDLRSQIEDADAVATVALLLKAAPRPDLSQVEPAQIA